MSSGPETAEPHWHLTDQPPSPAAYARLCTAVGWERYADEVRAAVALANSLAYATVTNDDEVVGMGRVVGDGAIVFYLQDIAVDPEHHGQGIGTAIVDSLMHQIDRLAPPGSFIGLFSAPRAAELYRRVGFESSNTGMSRYLPWDQPLRP